LNVLENAQDRMSYSEHMVKTLRGDLRGEPVLSVKNMLGSICPLPSVLFGSLKC